MNIWPLNEERKVEFRKYGSDLILYIASLPIPLLIIASAVLHFILPAHPKSFDPYMMLGILNTIFLFLAVCLVCYFTTRNYLLSGSWVILFLACGVLTLGTGTLIAGWLYEFVGTNPNVTLYNTSVLVGASFQIVAGVVSLRNYSSSDTSTRKKRLAIGYSGVFIFLTLLTVATLSGITPTFFTDENGPTLIRQIIVLIGMILFCIASFQKMLLFHRSDSRFFYWESHALALLAVSLFSAFFQRTVCDLLGWTSRTAIYIAGVYFIMAVVSALKEAQARGTSMDEIFGDFFQESRLFLKDILSNVGDAVVSCNEKGKILQWNQSAEKIFGYSRDEVIGKKIETILHQKNGFNFPASMGIEFKKKDGSIFLGEIYSSERKSIRGRLTTLVIRDVTERRKSEEFLKLSEEKFSKAFIGNASAMTIARLQDGYFLECNDRWLEMSGFSRDEIIGKTVFEIKLWKYPEERKKLIQELRSHGFVRDKEYEFIKKNGDNIIVLFSAQLTTLQGEEVMLTSTLDITERKQAEKIIEEQRDELEVVNSRLQALFDNSVVSMALYNVEVPYTVLAHNQYFQELHSECSKQNLIGKNIFDYTSSREAKEVIAIFDEVIKTKQAKNLSNYLYDHSFRGKTWWNWFISPIVKEDEVIALASISVNITNEIIARREAEAMAESLKDGHDELERKVIKRTHDLRQLNRTLQMISRCNQALAQATHEEALVQKICSIIHKEGGYRMVWVGMAEEDDQKSVRPVAYVGFEDDYLKNAKISWDENSERGQGPTGTAIRTGQVCIANDFQTEPSTSLWKEDALKRGYRSSIALPLSSEGKNFGALMLYADQPMTFDDNQVELLRELALNLSFGIMALRARKERDETMKVLEQRTIQLKTLALEMTRTEDRERQRLAQILHDHLQQLLAAASFNLVALQDHVKDEEGIEVIQKVDKILKESFDATRSLTTELSPQILARSGLAAALHWLATWCYQKHGLKVEVHAKGRVDFEGDEVRTLLFQSVRELLFNIVKHANVKNARVEMNKIANNLQVIVSDRGAGFDPAKLKNRQSATGGFGLFSLGQRFELVNGQLEIESAPGCGSRFILTVPLMDSADQSAKQDADVDQKSEAQLALPLEAKTVSDGSKKIRILIADDHSVVREGLAKVLKAESDLEVVGEACNGIEAIKFARVLKPDVILMDISMPLLDGIDTTRQLLKKNSECQVIGLSSFEDGVQGAAIKAAGAVAFLNKNISTKVLIQTIRDCSKPAQEKLGIIEREGLFT